jgi:hypothetical protein
VRLSCIPLQLIRPYKFVPLQILPSSYRNPSGLRIIECSEVSLVFWLTRLEVSLSLQANGRQELESQSLADYWAVTPVLKSAPCRDLKQNSSLYKTRFKRIFLWIKFNTIHSGRHISKLIYRIIFNTVQCDSICRYILPLHVSVSWPSSKGFKTQQKETSRHSQHCGRNA